MDLCRTQKLPMMWIAVVWFCVCALANGLDVQNVPEDMIGDRQDADHDAESAVLGDSPSSLNEQYGRPAVIPAKPMDTSIEEASERSKVPTTEGRLNPAFHFDAKAVMQEKVVGGGPITAGEAPFYVQIITKTGQGEWVNNGCGGSLISPRHVLTAAHCVDDIQNTIGRGNKGVYVNAYKPFDSIPGNNGGEPIHFSVMESVILHPDFDVVTLDHDVAVVTLIDPVPDTSIFTPIYLAENSPSDKDTVVVYGLGRLSEFSATKPDFVQKADLEYMSRNTCNIFYSNRLADSMFCAGFLYGGVDACNGDSGGPLIYETTEGVKEQVGVVSWGDGCALALKPGVYSNTVDQRTWIKSQVCPNLSTAEGIATPICVDDIASATPSAEPSAKPSAKPSSRPSGTPSIGPSASPSVSPSASPSARPSTSPSASSISDSPQPSTSSIPTQFPSSSSSPTTLPTTSNPPSSPPSPPMEIADLACFSKGEPCASDGDCCLGEFGNLVCNINISWILNPYDPNIPPKLCQVQKQTVTPRAGIKLSAPGGRSRGPTRKLRGAIR